MGCKQSKSAAVADRNGVAFTGKTPQTDTRNDAPAIQKSTTSKETISSKSSFRSTANKSRQGPRSDSKVFKLLIQQKDVSQAIVAVTPASAAFRDSKSKSTPLHLTAQLLDNQSLDSKEVLKMLSELIRAHPESVYTKDVYGNIPLHYALAPFTDYDATGDSAFVDHYTLRTAAVRLLLKADTTGRSTRYLNRNDVVYTTEHFGASRNNNHISAAKDKSMAGCSPLYRVIQTMPDDTTPQNATTLDYIRLLLQRMVETSSKTPSLSSTPHGTPAVCVGNACDGDKPLALLYRRFTRQFDLAEKFFAGDNSLDHVVQHRRRYKTAAGHTWKLIEVLLQFQQNAAQKTVYRTVHRAVQGETPPDLLRYIVETNAEDLTVADEAGNMPLHYAAKSKPPQLIDSKSNTDKTASFPAFYSKYVMDELLYKYPQAASKVDAQGLYPLTLAVRSGKQWIGGGIKSLFDAYPPALEQIDMGEHPSLRRALSMDAAAAALEEQLSGGGGEQMTPTSDDRVDIVRDEQHDAIMLVQQEDVDISEVVTSMWAHEEDAGVQMLGCVAISRLLRKNTNDTQNQSEHVLQNALTSVPAVVNAMKAHPNEVIVQEKACHALSQMASSDGQREVSFVASGAVAAIVGAMQAHVSDCGVQEEACAAISGILQVGGVGADRATVVASVSGLTAMVNAIAAHPDVRGVQEQGCRALSELLRYGADANLPELPRSQTEALLVAAQQRFPRECGEAVTTLLQRLSE